ncbi:putative phage abortive infection protein [Ancylomarina longa]|nr:putative phage abortive infection protein [Ancylomarina longa]
MVKYYRENISEMRFRNPFYYEGEKGRKVDEEYVTGRRVIKTIFEQYKVALKHVDEQLFSNMQVLSKCKFTYENENYTNIDKYNLNYKRDIIDKENWNKFHTHSNLAYLITFWGTPHDITTELDNRLSEVAKEWKNSDDSIVKNIIESARKLIAVYDCQVDPGDYSGSLKNKDRSITKCGRSKGKLNFFGGHQYHLAHYFRHFYRSVKYIDKQPSWLLSEEEKKEYIELLRAQMSNYEQALLFINSISSLGENWEYSGGVDLITKYDLIRNLPEYFIPLPANKDEYLKPQYFYPNVDFEWKKKTSKKK